MVNIEFNQIVNMRVILVLISGALILLSCASLPHKGAEIAPRGPDYSNLDFWAAHPDKNDPADLIPQQIGEDHDQIREADIFFIHPTTYTSGSIDGMWNGPLNHAKLNKKTDEGTIQYQASIFNKAGRVYAPRYRQAHLQTFFTVHNELAELVFDLAYNDVQNAFSYYLEEENQGRPFIIASHSQGTTHAVRLIRAMVDGHDIQSQLVAAYLVGMPVHKNVFESIPPCKNSNDLNCFVSWRTYKRGHIPANVALGDSIAVHNPLSWTQDDTYINKESNRGAILRNFNKIIPQATDAQVKDGILWASKPKFAFSFLFTRRNYHIADLNFYYMNVRQNAYQRVEQFVQNKLSN